jgi:hypothetical protein
MSKKQVYSTGGGVEGQKIAFVAHDHVTNLPDRPGLFVLTGTRGGDRDTALYFGYADRSMRDQVPYDPGFAQAIRQGLVGFASAYVPGASDPRDLVHRLAEAYGAPVNAAADALAEIDAAQSAQAKARRIAAQ